MIRFAVLLVLATGMATVRPATAFAWYCRANASDGHHGWASSFDRHHAAEEALRECANRSHQPITCRIFNCIPD